ncbi:hypothetical protein ColKHC_10096 [Colletotrichum higginsianum]|nr:hypothetical protein ColKHC_10096 [Colletotrichum higginsianum]
MTQADLVSGNMAALIHKTGLHGYETKTIDGHTEAGLAEGSGVNIMIPHKSKGLDFEVGQACWYLSE